MFRNIAIALVAASVLAAPAMAQTTLSGGSQSPQTSQKPATEGPEKAEKTPEKSAETADTTVKSTTKHHKVARHHRHPGAKAAKLSKSRTTSTAMVGKHHGLKTSKYAKAEGRRMAHGRHAYGKLPRKGAPVHTYGRAPKHMHMRTHTPSKSTSSPSVD